MQIYVVVFCLPGVLKTNKAEKYNYNEKVKSPENNCIKANKSVCKCIIHSVGG